MRATLVNLTETQREYLKEMKTTHGLSMSGFIRQLIMRSMLGIGNETYQSPYVRVRGVKQKRDSELKDKCSPQAEMIGELKTVLADRRAKVEVTA